MDAAAAFGWRLILGTLRPHPDLHPLSAMKGQGLTNPGATASGICLHPWQEGGPRVPI